MSLVLFTRPVSEDSGIRRANLRRLCAARLLDARGLSARVGSRYSYWRDMLTDEKKSFGEKIARRIEEALELPRGWLDVADAQVPDPSEMGDTPDPRATLVVADMLNKASRDDYEIWAATILRDMKRNPDYAPEDVARFESALRAMRGPTGPAN